MAERRMKPARRCRHTSPFIRDIDVNGGPYGQAISRWCVGCRDYIPWGPARITPEVAIEMEAARIAQDAADDEWLARKLNTGMEPSDIGWGWFFADGRPVEILRGERLTRLTLNADCLAGALARCIHDHDATGREG